MLGHGEVRLRAVTFMTVLVLASTSAIPAAEATPGAPLGTASFAELPNFMEHVAGMVVSPDGSRIFVTGTLGRFTGDRWETVAYDASGTQLWNRHYKGPGSFNEQAAA